MSERFPRPGSGGSVVERATDDLLNALPDAALLLGRDFRIVFGNSPFQQLSSRLPDELEGKLLWEAGAGQWNLADLRALLDSLVAEGCRSGEARITVDTAKGKKVLDVSASVLDQSAREPILIVLHDATTRVEAERSCRESEDRFRRFVDSLTDYAVVFFDPGATIVGWNFGAAAIFGWQAEEAVGRPGSIIFTPEDVASGAPETEIQSAAKTGRAEDERWHTRKNGERFFASGVVTALRDESGTLLGFTKVLRDITRRYEAEMERERLLNERHALLDSAGEGIFGVDLNGRCTFINAAATSMLGYTAEECVGNDLHALAHHHRADGTPYPREECPVYKAAVYGNHAHVSSEVIWRKEGSSLPVAYTVRPVRVDGAIEGAVVTLRDVSAERATAERVAHKRRQLEELTHTLDLAQSMIRTVNGTITFWSSGAEQLYGFSREEAVGQISHVLLRTHSQRSLDSITEECIQSGHWHGELRHTRKDGAFLWVSSHWAVHEDEDGGAKKIVEVNNDITARRKAEEAMRRTNEALESFAYAASHDLKEPLRTITSYLQLLDRRYGGSLDEDAREFIRLCVDGSERMRELIDSLLAYARAGTDEADATPVSADAALQDAIANLGGAINDTRAQIAADPLPEVRVHAAQLSQVFQNLLSNAIKYRKPDLPPVIEVGADRIETAWRFCFRDHGMGFDQSDAERIFGLFRRLHGRDVPGTGVGLALTRRIVEHYGGEVWAESEPGKGATFYFTLPD